MSVQLASVARISNVRRVEIGLGTEDTMKAAGHGRFRPDKLVITYQHYANSPEVETVTLYGPMVRADGNEYVDNRRGHVSVPPNAAPDWIKNEVDRYRPR